MLEPTFVQIKTPDHFTLPGLLYEPKKKRAVAIYLHGNGSSSVFYHDDQLTEWVPAFAKLGVALLFFNNRGAHLLKSLRYKKSGKNFKTYGGMAYEKIRDCVSDIDGVIAFLRQRGYHTFYLIGSSTGANKICVYNHYKPRNQISGYVLLSGGDDTGIYYHQLGRKRFYALLKRAQTNTRQGRGAELIKEIFPELLFSHQAFYDIANPDGDYNTFPFYETMRKIKLSRKPRFRYFKEIKKPTLVVYGGKDEYCWGDVPGVVEILQKLKLEFSYKIISGADHGFSGQQRKLTKIMADWLRSI
ncbi:hypothetical protein A2477_01005 [Candidatus Falkowbacteria bacterium RIFOXYC2_FULL_47_12]|uniref:Serine aminopeptidase S33 domain-containing protein n=1 Tax=Candidatus Falkowbacteria bacterium RIFOXYC2_FULL_47_12 TaxID=1798004 RepID=A0A1F5TRY7_9BACT|nr:MAG: hypothetical protein A2477_01005 [Candidatus Falkowbacteria bacterium RIFOXYC2_FULL_47_12]